MCYLTTHTAKNNPSMLELTILLEAPSWTRLLMWATRPNPERESSRLNHLLAKSKELPIKTLISLDIRIKVAKQFNPKLNKKIDRQDKEWMVLSNQECSHKNQRYRKGHHPETESKRNGLVLSLLDLSKRSVAERSLDNKMQVLKTYLERHILTTVISQITWTFLLQPRRRTRNGHQLDKRKLQNNVRTKNSMVNQLKSMEPVKRAMAVWWLTVQIGKTCNRPILIPL